MKYSFYVFFGRTLIFHGSFVGFFSFEASFLVVTVDYVVENDFELLTPCLYISIAEIAGMHGLNTKLCVC